MHRFRDERPDKTHATVLLLIEHVTDHITSKLQPLKYLTQQHYIDVTLIQETKLISRHQAPKQRIAQHLDGLDNMGMEEALSPS